MRAAILILLVTLVNSPSLRAQAGKTSPPRKRMPANSVSVGAGYGVFGLGYALGVEYERKFGKDGAVSIVLPVTWSESRVSADAGAYGRESRNRYASLFAAPGLLYHPAGGYEPVDLSLGVQVAVGDLSARSDGYWAGGQAQSSTFVAPMGVLNVIFRSRHSNSQFGVHIAVGSPVQGSFGRSASGGEAEKPVFFEGGIRFGGYF